MLFSKYVNICSFYWYKPVPSWRFVVIELIIQMLVLVSLFWILVFPGLST